MLRYIEATTDDNTMIPKPIDAEGLSAATQAAIASHHAGQILEPIDERGMAAAFQAAQAAIAAHHAGITAVAAIHYAPPVDPDSLMDAPEVCAFFGRSPMSIWRWRKAGVLPAPIVIQRRNFWKRRTIYEVAAQQAHLQSEAA